MIEFKKIEKSFGQNRVLKAIDLAFADNGIAAIIGPNGSGKTTLIKSFLGLISPDAGDILFKGESILGKYKYRNQVSYLPQIAKFPENLSSQQIISMVMNLRSGELRKDYLIDLFDFNKELNKKVSQLSGGNKQKLNLILTLMYDNPIIIMDEPNNGLDPITMLKLKAFIVEEKGRGKLIVLTSHEMSLVEELAIDLVFILDGCIHFNGKLQNLLEEHNTNKLEKATAAILSNH